MSGRPLLLGHRGARASAGVPENSLASFDLALQHGCDGFEFDLRLTDCGRALVCHDPEVEGVTVSQASCDHLRQLPVFREVLQRYAKRAFLDVELKVPGLESEVLVDLRQFVPEKGYVVSSFLPEVLTDLRVRSAVTPLGFLCDRPDMLAHWCELSVEYVIPQHRLVTRQLVEQVHDAGRKLLTWTVNDKSSMVGLAEWGVDGIISDETELLARTLG